MARPLSHQFNPVKNNKGFYRCKRFPYHEGRLTNFHNTGAPFLVIMNKKLLVPIDRTEPSSNLFHYLSQLFAHRNDIELHLFSVCKIDSAINVLRDDSEKDILAALSPREKLYYKSCLQSLENDKKRLERRGFKPSCISFKVKLTSGDYAKLIADEACQKGCDAIVVREVDNVDLKEQGAGSLSATLREQTEKIPVWLINGYIESKKFLVPVDGTNQSLQSAKHLGFIIGGDPQAEITLFNADTLFFKKAPINPEDYYEQWTSEWTKKHLDRPDRLFHAPEQILLEQGLKEEQIKRVTTKKGIYPSRQILRQALIGDFGTIVMSQGPQGFSRGIFKSVTAKVCAMAEDVAIWLTGDF